MTLPNEQINPDDARRRLHELDRHLREKIKGQNEVIDPVFRTLKRGEMPGLQGVRKRPKGTMLFVGPSGVGKTELTLEFSNFLFGPGHLFRFDMSEFTLHESASTLLGRYENDEGRFGKTLGGRKRGTILFDEIEKAHPLVIDTMLQILDAGRITTANNVTHDLTGFYIVLTSNIGAREAMGMTQSNRTQFKKTILNKVLADLRPELNFRISKKIVFAPLDEQTQSEIGEDLIQAALRRLGAAGHRLTINQDAKNLILELGIDRKAGIRPLSNVVDDMIEGALADAWLEGRSTSGHIVVNEDRDRLILS